MSTKNSSLKTDDGFTSVFLGVAFGEEKVSSVTVAFGKVKMEIGVDKFRVVGLRHEDGSGHKFIVDAYINGKLGRFYFNTDPGARYLVHIEGVSV